MPYGYSMRSLALVHHWGYPFNQEKWDRLVSKVCFHKLAYRVHNEVINGSDNYYHYIIDKSDWRMNMPELENRVLV